MLVTSALPFPQSSAEHCPTSVAGFAGPPGYACSFAVREFLSRSTCVTLAQRNACSDAPGGIHKRFGGRRCPLLHIGRKAKNCREFGRAGRVKVLLGCLHQVVRLAAWTPEPPAEVITAGSRLRQRPVGFADDRSATVATWLALVIDRERLGPATLRITAATQKRAVPTCSFNRAGTTHLTSDDAGLNLF